MGRSTLIDRLTHVAQEEPAYVPQYLAPFLGKTVERGRTILIVLQK